MAPTHPTPATPEARAFTGNIGFPPGLTPGYDEPPGGLTAEDFPAGAKTMTLGRTIIAWGPRDTAADPVPDADLMVATGRYDDGSRWLEAVKGKRFVGLYR